MDRARILLSLLLNVPIWVVPAASPVLASETNIKHSYDGAGRLVRTEYSTGVSISYAYDPAGNLLRIKVVLGVSGLYFPFYQAGGNTFVGFAVSNYSEHPANLEFTAFASDGSQENFGRNPSSYLLEAGKQLARQGWEIFSINPSAVRGGWVRLTTDNSEIGSFFLFGDTALSQMDGSVAFESQSTDFYFTRVFEGPNAYRGQAASTWVSIANPNGEPIRVRFKFHGVQAGGLSPLQAVSDKVIQIPAQGYLYRTLGQLFEVTALPLGWVEGTVVEGPGAVAFELVQLLGHATLIGLNASFGNSQTDSFSAQLAEISNVLFTSLKLINVSGQPRQLTLRVVREEGGDLAEPVQATLQPGQFLERDASDIFDFTAVAGTGAALQAGSSNVVGSLHVAADGPGVIGDVVFGDPSAFRFAASMPLQTERFTKAVFSQVAQVASLGFFTGVALYNPSQEAANVIIDVLTPEGESIGEQTEELHPGQRISKQVNQLVGLTQDQFGGYIVITSDVPIIAQQLFGRTNLNMMSAVPPRVIR